MTRIVLDIDDTQWKVDHLARVMRSAESEFLSELAAQVDIQVTDARPLIVLDLKDFDAGYVIEVLRHPHHLWANRVADQIEAQTKPARIPEPAWGAIVEAHSLGAKGDRLHWVKGSAGWTNLDATGEYLNWISWDCLIDPTLIREGIES